VQHQHRGGYCGGLVYSSVRSRAWDSVSVVTVIAIADKRDAGLTPAAGIVGLPAAGIVRLPAAGIVGLPATGGAAALTKVQAEGRVSFSHVEFLPEHISSGSGLKAVDFGRPRVAIAEEPCILKSCMKVLYYSCGLGRASGVVAGVRACPVLSSTIS